MKKNNWNGNNWILKFFRVAAKYPGRSRDYECLTCGYKSGVRNGKELVDTVTEHLKGNCRK